MFLIFIFKSFCFIVSRTPNLFPCFSVLLTCLFISSGWGIRMMFESSSLLFVLNSWCSFLASASSKVSPSNSSNIMFKFPLFESFSNISCNMELPSICISLQNTCIFGLTLISSPSLLLESQITYHKLSSSFNKRDIISAFFRATIVFPEP